MKLTIIICNFAGLSSLAIALPVQNDSKSTTRISLDQATDIDGEAIQKRQNDGIDVYHEISRDGPYVHGSVFDPQKFKPSTVGHVWDSDTVLPPAKFGPRPDKVIDGPGEKLAIVGGSLSKLGANLAGSLADLVS